MDRNPANHEPRRCLAQPGLLLITQAMKNILFAMPFVVLCAFPVRAADVYMVQGDARGPVVGPDLILWTTDGFFYNNTAADAHVLFLGVSNGPPKPEAPAELVIRPQHSASFSTARLNGAWRPLSDAQLWVIHLDV